LPFTLNGTANNCLVTSGSIDSVSSRGAQTFTINGVSYLNQMS
jgi:endo-1,4-beta-xylanase